ncbi:hypothetical protein BV20DRAFT_744542 [Pilatotrama ljubarskyi]|nr:hypothetical protein BV20DRAFT_744542 [Pilatotrama ljubarskyi]
MSHECAWRVPCGGKQLKASSRLYRPQARRRGDALARTNLPIPHIDATHARVPSSSYHACRPAGTALHSWSDATQPAKTVQQKLQSARRDWVRPIRRRCRRQISCRVGCAGSLSPPTTLSSTRVWREHDLECARASGGAVRCTRSVTWVRVRAWPPLNASGQRLIRLRHGRV